jgi:hypothetical protein
MNAHICPQLPSPASNITGLSARNLLKMTLNTSIIDIPIELFLSYILWHLPLADLLSLSCCSKAFAQICSVDSFWQQKLQTDFEIAPSHVSHRLCKCKKLYQRALRPRLYVWGYVISPELAMILSVNCRFDYDFRKLNISRVHG